MNNEIEKLKRQLIELEKDRDDWKREFQMYRRAWIRELGGTLISKTHDIDALVLTTVALREERDILKEKLNQILKVINE